VTNKKVNIGIFLVLILIYCLGIFIRTESFTIRGHSNSHLFTIESAQHYYHTALVAQGKRIPKIDKLLAWPEGFDTRTDTNLEEYVVGTSPFCFNEEQDLWDYWGLLLCPLPSGHRALFRKSYPEGAVCLSYYFPSRLLLL